MLGDKIGGSFNARDRYKLSGLDDAEYYTKLIKKLTRSSIKARDFKSINPSPSNDVQDFFQENKNVNTIKLKPINYGSFNRQSYNLIRNSPRNIPWDRKSPIY